MGVLVGAAEADADGVADGVADWEALTEVDGVGEGAIGEGVADVEGWHKDLKRARC